MNIAYFALHCSNNRYQRVMFWKKNISLLQFLGRKKAKRHYTFLSVKLHLVRKGKFNSLEFFSNLIEKNFYIYKFKVKPFSLVSLCLAKTLLNLNFLLF